MMHEAYGYQRIGRPWWGEHEGEQITTQMQNKLAWYGHFRFGLHEQIPQTVKYITIIREPASRLVSEYHRNRYKERYNMSLVDLAKSDKGNNLMVRMISGASLGDKLTDWHLQKALQNIKDHFAFVGQTNLFKRILAAVRRLGWSVSKIPHENKGIPGETPLEHLMMIRKLPELALDYELYRRLSHDL